jgi:hypothetical protein
MILYAFLAAMVSRFSIPASRRLQIKKNVHKEISQAGIRTLVGAKTLFSTHINSRTLILNESNEFLKKEERIYLTFP